ncbi:MAG: ABC transporter ATP-binding protein [Burkholderiaceae bacterium]|jgi:branched-chain amino acid transport system ATP-binding protein|nr:ABC transporter ATP-binding protein [Burkholderiaceae bacterium]
MADALLELRGVWSGYRRTTVLEGLDLSVNAGEAVAIVGRNGVGKTTLLETIMGHLPVARGTMRLRGADLATRPPHARASLGIGYVPQQREIFPSLSVLENLSIAQRPGEWTVERALELFPRLAQRRASGGTQLSGGEQQMLAIARGLVANPALLLMDEPSEGLAPTIVAELARVLARIRAASAMAMVLVEQKTAIAFDFAPRCVVMDRGRVVYDGASAALSSDADRLARLVGVGREVRRESEGVPSAR